MFFRDGEIRSLNLQPKIERHLASVSRLSIEIGNSESNIKSSILKSYVKCAIALDCPILNLRINLR